MICSNCGFTNEDDAPLCVICGEKLIPSAPQSADKEEQVCPECGHKGESWLGLCPKCGVLMTSQASSNPDHPLDTQDVTPSPNELDFAEKLKSEEMGEWETETPSPDSNVELWTDENPISRQETSMKQVSSTLDTLLSDLLEIEIREKERNDLLGELNELPPSLYSDPEETPKKRKILLQLPSISTQTRSLLEWFLIFALIFTLFIFGLSAGIWSSIQIL